MKSMGLIDDARAAATRASVFASICLAGSMLACSASNDGLQPHNAQGGHAGTGGSTLLGRQFNDAAATTATAGAGGGGVGSGAGGSVAGDAGGALPPTGPSDAAGDAPRGGADAPAACVGPTCGSGNPRGALGSLCAGASDCESGSCADGVCCNLACTGACVSCNQAGKMGECTMVAAGKPDLHGICRAEPAATCGQNGSCNGLGACAKHAPGTECRPAACSGTNLVPAGTCNGSGTCVAGSPISCAPSMCVENACKLTCQTSADCAPGSQCTNGSCGLRGPGQMCTAGTQCRSGFCADGVCCESACAGKCSYCAFPNSLGRCVAVAANLLDPRVAAGITNTALICPDQGAPSCGTNGRCDGSGGCQRYGTGTVCKNESCDSTTNRYTGAGTCQNGACVTPSARGCSPNRCSGARCGTSCSSDQQCWSPNVCQGGSCGKRPVSSVCSKASDCASGQCAQGVCCSTACTASCFSCNIAGSVGTCTAVGDGGVDPAGLCLEELPASCGNDGTCNGSGGCRKYDDSTICAAQKCVSGVFTSASVCSGTGTCLAGSQIPCAPYVCNAGGTACYDTCTVVTSGQSPQCLAPNRCRDVNGTKTCGPAADGQPCTSRSQCQSNYCVDGLCCNESCSGTCRSCNLPGNAGKCTFLADTDGDIACPIDVTKPCGNTGKCDGKGKCALAPGDKPCAAAMCTTATGGLQGATCDGVGACKTPAPLVCGFNRCEGDACKPCANDADCTGGRSCDVATGNCGGLSANGVACTLPDGSECASGVCLDGICCERACGTCQKCENTQTERGKCTNVPSGQTDVDSCPNELTVNKCGKTGKCDGAGACLKVAPGTQCDVVCSGQSAVPRSCGANETCSVSGTPQPCGQFVCVPGTNGAPASCAVSCSKPATGCPAGKVCVGGDACKDCDPLDNAGCTLPAVCDPMTFTCVTKTPLGGTCSASSECVGNAPCVDNRCCASASCGMCMACTGAGGMCVAVTNQPDPNSCPNETMGASPNPCGKLGCDAAGVCQFVAAATACGTPTCKNSNTAAETSACNGSGSCVATIASCMPGYKCDAGVCATSCTSNSQCVSPSTCIIPPGMTSGTCGKKPLGGACGTDGTVCQSGFCADGVCCENACDGDCRTCGAMGFCGEVTSAPDPDTCPDQTTGPNPKVCGKTGCNAVGACQYVAPTTVCARSCSGDVLTETMCSGATHQCDGAVEMTNCAASGKVCEMNMCVMPPPGAEPPPPDASPPPPPDAEPPPLDSDPATD